LVSKVKQVCEEEIVDQGDDIKNLGVVGTSKKVVKPDCYHNTLLDIALGLNLQEKDDFVDFFSGLSKNRNDGKLTIGEFEKGINGYLNCGIDKDDSYAVHKFTISQ
jgi:hypothetical protein